MNSRDLQLDWPEGVIPTAEFAAAGVFLAESSGNLFVTGRAGTSNLTLQRATHGAIGSTRVVVAPTGCVSIYVGEQAIL